MRRGSQVAGLVGLALLGLALFLMLRGGDGDQAAEDPSRRIRHEGGPADGPGGSVAATTERRPAKAGDRPPRGEHPRTVTTASGLEYTVLREGSGPRPGPADRVEVHYVGTTLDGKRFDGTDEDGQPRKFPLNMVIKGWTEGLQLMRAGGKFRFVIPPELAYGKSGAPGRIGPDETLVFEIELVGFEGAQEKE